LIYNIVHNIYVRAVRCWQSERKPRTLLGELPQTPSRLVRETPHIPRPSSMLSVPQFLASLAL